jgi:DNA-3-methyladenine glycosylase
MFGPPGRAYVYLVYGMYDCLNVVTEAEGRPAALLVRAVEPIEGLGLMQAARAARHGRRSEGSAPARTSTRRLPNARIASGPGLVCLAFGIDRRDSGRDLCDPASPLRLELPAPGDRRAELVTTARIGIGYAAQPWHDYPWRFIDPSSPAVSGRSS